MGAITITYTASTRKTERKLLRRSKKRRMVAVNGDNSDTVLSGKLEALKSLIPAQNSGKVKADTLFQQTANYILLLRTQVSILQELLQFYKAADINGN